MLGRISIVFISILLLISTIDLGVYILADPRDLLNKPAPDFTLEALDGTSIHLSSYRGYVVLLDFFATWCGPCKKAIPYIGNLHEMLAGKKFISISIDLHESKNVVSSFAQSYKMSWTVVIDNDGSVFNKYMVTAIPTFFVIDKDGIIRHVQVGFSATSFDQVKQKILELLSGETASFDFTISVSPSSVEINQGESTTLVVTVTKTSGTAKPVTLTLVGLPSGASYSLNPTTVTPTGSSTLTINAGSAKGTYTLLVKGTADGLEKTAIFTITIKEKKCIIATVTYGSEVSNEVNLLRRFRDDIVLNSYAGQRFYIAFNTFYYSWSPYIAQIIHENGWLKTPFKIILYPLIGILYISVNLMYFLMFLNQEFVVYLAGTLIAAMLGMIYLSPLLILLKMRKGGKNIELLIILFLALSTFSQFLGIGLMVTVFTSIYVIVVMICGALFLSEYVILSLAEI